VLDDLDLRCHCAHSLRLAFPCLAGADEPLPVRRDASDVRMIQRGQQLRLALEPRDSIRIGDEHLRQDFDGRLATERRVERSTSPIPPAPSGDTIS
jgi:hypothetical protein